MVQVYKPDSVLLFRKIIKTLRFSMYAMILLLVTTHQSNARPGIKFDPPPVNEVHGFVTDSTGKGMESVSVKVKGATRGTLTGRLGEYSLSNVPNDAVLEFSFIGYQTQDVPVNGRSSISVTLQALSTTLSDVVIVGYGTQKREAVTASISSVSGAELVKAPVTDISNALKGQLAGLIAIQGSGQPGNNGSALLIRGVGTFTGQTAPLVMVDGIARDTYDDIDPNEIASVSILKDASATAVYGVRGANGVILITTKRGKEGAPKISLTGQTALTSFTNAPKFVNSYQYGVLSNELSFENYWTTFGGNYSSWNQFVQDRDANWVNTASNYFSPQSLLYYQNAHTPTVNGQPNPYYSPYLYPDVNWESMLFKKNTPTSQANLNISGGTKFVKYFLSLGYLNEGGLLQTNYMQFPNQMNYGKQRYNLRGNFDFDVTSKFKVSVEVATQFINETGMSNYAYAWEKVILWTNPFMTPGMINGKYVIPFSNQNAQLNPMLSLEQQGYSLVTNSILNSAVKGSYLLDDVTKGLSVNGKASYDSYFQSQSTGGLYNPAYYGIQANPNGNNLDPVLVLLSPAGIPSVGAQGYSAKWRNAYEELSVNYDRTFGKSHVTGLLLGDANKRYDPTLEYDLPHAYLGLVGRVTYAWDDKYFAEYDMGYNGSENFAPGKRFGYLPSYSAGWIISKEKFFPKNDIVPYAKLRGSYGTVGNDNINIPGTTTSARYLYLPNSWQYGSGYTFGQYGSQTTIQGATEATLGNPDVTWEVSHNLDLSLELHFYKDKISLIYDYYHNHRTNILAYMQTVPAIVAASLPPYNIGIMNSWGHEFELTYNDHAGKFNYYVKANVALDNNKIIYMDEAILPNLQYQAQTGHPYGQQLLLQADGLYTSWSQLYALDANGNPILTEPVLAKNSQGQPYTNAAGQPVYQKDLGYNGVLPQPGEIRLKDVNGDGVVNANDEVRSGNTTTPKLTYGVTVGFNVYGFDFSVLFAGVGGVAANGMPSDDIQFSKQQSLYALDWNRFTLDRYQAGDKINFPMADYNQAAIQNTYFLINTKYTRLQNVSIGYTIQEKLHKKLKVQSIRIYVSGNNLYTWSPNKIWGDPENLGSAVYPLTKTYNAGLNINF